MNEKELEKMLKALANKRRLAILKVLGAGKEKMVGEIEKLKRDKEDAETTKV